MLLVTSTGGVDYVGFELDPDYYAVAKERLEREKSQLRLFDFAQQEEEQTTLFERRF